MSLFLLVFGCAPTCAERIEANDAVLAKLMEAVAERQPWDLQADRGTTPPRLEAPLVVREHPSTLLVRRAKGGWTLHGQPIRSDEPARLCAGLDRQRQTLDRMRAAGINVPFRVALDVDEGVPAAEVQTLLGQLAGCGVEEVDALVVRARPPHVPSLPALPDVPAPLSTCPLPDSVAEASFEQRPQAFREGTRAALAACDCAVDPARFALMFREALIPAVFTNVVPLSTRTTLAGGTWSEALRAR